MIEIWRVEFKCSHREKKVNMWGDGCVKDLIIRILSQQICVKNHSTVHFKYVTILFVNYTSKTQKIQLTSHKMWKDCSDTRQQMMFALIISI